MTEECDVKETAGLWGTLCRTLQDARTFFRAELWDADVRGLPRLKKLAYSLVRIGWIVLRGFSTDRCTLQASALTYFTLMSMVPVLALMFSVAKGVGAQDRLMDTIGLARTAEPGQYEIVGGMLADLPEQAAQVATVLFRAVDNTSFGALGAVGVALLFWSVVKVMGKIEASFNIIWGVRESRTLVRKFADFISILVMVPILMLLATSANAMLSSAKVTGMLQERLGPLFWIYERGLGFTGLFVIFVAFVCLYMFMPNTRVHFFPAILGGVIGGGLWYLSQSAYFSLQVGLAKNNAIYGTFAAVPFFLFWVYLSWVIVLFGAEIAFAVQNFRTYALEQRAGEASVATRHALAAILVYEIARAHLTGDGPWAYQQFCETIGVPVRLVSAVLQELTDARIVVPVGDRATTYVPARDTGKLGLGDVENALRGTVSPKVAALIADHSDLLDRAVREHAAVLSGTLGKTTFRDLIQAEAHAHRN